MSEIVKTTNEDIVRVSSREVSVMMDIRHDNLIAKIEKHTEIFKKVTDLKNKVSDLWIESTYKDSTGRTLKDYKISKKGCEFLAHKTTGEKGDLFTIKYMDRFEEMEKSLKKQKVLSPMEQLKLQYQVLEDHEQRFEKIEERLDSLEINPHQKRAIQRAKSKRVVELLGGRKSVAYKDASLRAKVYADMGRQYNNYFDISEYAYTPRNRYEEALELIATYNLTVELSMEVRQRNNQLKFL
ncbi:Rha family transcriptional regulator [Romboutsia sp. 1001713B170131_170501_G6]|uniref:Rha family transcriptional regulator n=1 Tax=Romboutsia sp. 1001713B170131_170501_G6 TaxID=2787108 RepID=UPI0018AC1D97|nr:Rha family transcriptional regulator [Romboutsia sp. 1001713B170131_170501_G6]